MAERLIRRCARRRPVQLVAALMAILPVLAGVAMADSTSGDISPASQLTANGHLLHPAGRLTTVGDFPTGSAVLPGGHFLWVADCGHGTDDIKVVDLGNGSVVQTLPCPAATAAWRSRPTATTRTSAAPPRAARRLEARPRATRAM